MDVQDWFVTLGIGGISTFTIWSFLDPMDHQFPLSAIIAGCCLFISAIVITITVEIFNSQNIFGKKDASATKDGRKNNRGRFKDRDFE